MSDKKITVHTYAELAKRLEIAERRLHAAEQVIETVREMVDASPDESVIEAVQRIKNERDNYCGDCGYHATLFRAVSLLGCSQAENVLDSIKLLKTANEDLLLEISDLKEIIYRDGKITLDNPAVRANALLDLALAVIDGSIRGVSADTIRSLRE